ncbi:hypothetical protein K502DRAFT_349352 [Neoconidiobolus thromboides FSU 785]|nr:hypothetical protein K502DRAFT_349352 [Neoconidiobolus thromboides FSU 785]
MNNPSDFGLITPSIPPHIFYMVVVSIFLSITGFCINKSSGFSFPTPLSLVPGFEYLIIEKLSLLVHWKSSRVKKFPSKSISLLDCPYLSLSIFSFSMLLRALDFFLTHYHGPFNILLEMETAQICPEFIEKKYYAEFMYQFYFKKL